MQYDTSYRDRWITPNSPLTEPELRVLDALHAHADGFGRVEMGHRVLARVAGVGSKHDAHRAAKALCARRAVRVIAAEPGTPTRWRVLQTVEALAERVGLESGVRL